MERRFNFDSKKSNKEIKIPIEGSFLTSLFMNPYHHARVREELLLASDWSPNISRKIPVKYPYKSWSKEEHYLIGGISYQLNLIYRRIHQNMRSHETSLRTCTSSFYFLIFSAPYFLKKMHLMLWDVHQRIEGDVNYYTHLNPKPKGLFFLLMPTGAWDLFFAPRVLIQEDSWFLVLTWDVAPLFGLLPGGTTWPNF